MGRPGFPPKSAPSSGKSCFSVFGPEFLPVSRGCHRPKGPQIPVFCDFPPLGVQSVKTLNVKKLRNFQEKLLGRPVFPPQTAPSSGKSCFSFFGPGLRISPSARNPKQAKIPPNHRFRRVGVRPNFFLAIKLRNTIPDSAVTFFFHFWAPYALPARKGPMGLVACLLA